jgi:molybdate transport system regulatory protein
MPHEVLPLDLEIRSKLWVERDGKVALSEWRVDLLLAIDETGSLAAAAEKLHVPYRTAWYKLKGAEETLGVKLVDSESGGKSGGQTRLTPQGRDLAERFNIASQEIGRAARQRLQSELDGIVG